VIGQNRLPVLTTGCLGYFQALGRKDFADLVDTAMWKNAGKGTHREHRKQQSPEPLMNTLVFCSALILLLCAMVARKIVRPCNGDRCIIRKCRNFIKQTST